MSRFGLVLALAVLILCASTVCAVGLGAFWVNPLSLLTESDDLELLILRDFRVPRVLLAALVGGALATVGTTLQSVMKNALVDPYVLGISSGASIGAALAAWSGFLNRGVGPTLAAFITALFSVFLVYRIAETGGRLPALRLVLAGVAFSSFATAVTGLLLFLVPQATQVRGIVFWLMGGLSAADWPSVVYSALLTIPALVFLLFTWRWQNLLVLGDETALSLGLEAHKARARLITISALITATTVAYAGAIGFVGLIVPHALRPFVGADHRRLLPLSMLVGASLLVWMDALARIALAPRELPVGILTGLLGAPFFLFLLRRFPRD